MVMIEAAAIEARSRQEIKMSIVFSGWFGKAAVAYVRSDESSDPFFYRSWRKTASPRSSINKTFFIKTLRGRRTEKCTIWR